MTQLTVEYGSYETYNWVRERLRSQWNCQLVPSWPSNAIWWHRSVSTLAQVMACCQTAPSHYLNQCWLIISEVLWHSPKGKFTGKILILDISLIITNLRLQLHLPGANEFNILRPEQNDCCFAEDIFKSIFFNDKIRILINIPHWNMLLKVRLKVSGIWFR